MPCYTTALAHPTSWHVLRSVGISSAVLFVSICQRPTILLSEGESNPPVSYASRAGHSALAKSILATLSRAYRHPPRSLSSDPTANPVGRKRSTLGAAKHPCSVCRYIVAAHIIRAYCAIRWGACQSLPRGHRLFVVRSGIEPDTVRNVIILLPITDLLTYHLRPR